MNREFPRVLVVEDEPMPNYMFCWLFQTWKWEFRRAFTCAQAQILLRGSTVFDLVVLDLLLPDQDGINILRWLRETKYDARIAVITQKDQSECDEARTLKPDLMLPKPFVIEALKLTAEQVWDNFFTARANLRMQFPVAPRTPEREQ